MTVALELVQGALPQGPLYHSDRGLMQHQAEPVAEAYLSDGVIVESPPGSGKTHVGMALAALLFEDGLIDVCLMVGEKGKIIDFAQVDFPRFTELSTGAYHGPKRAKLLESPPQVLCTNYETGRNDICTFKKGGRAVESAGPLTEFLRGKRVLVVFDEVIVKMRSRSGQTYRAWDYLINRVLRKHCPFVRVLGMTAFTMERHPEDHFNLGRVIRPELAGTVAQFEADHVASWWEDAPGGRKPDRLKNISPADHQDPDVVPLSKKLAPAIFRVTEAEIAHLFPAMDERAPMLVELSARHRGFLDLVDEVVTERELGDGVAWNLTRMATGHPLALTRSEGWLARMIAEVVGEDGLREIGSTKTDRLLEWARRLGDAQAVIFTFYGQSVLPVLHEALAGAGLTVSINHGQMTTAERQRSQDAFKGGHRQIFLSSDAGARGLNLGCGRSVVEYEPALTYGTHKQRIDRIRRVDSAHSWVTADCLVGLRSPDESALANQLKRHEWTEQVRGEDHLTEDVDADSGVLTSEMRRRALARVRTLR